MASYTIQPRKSKGGIRFRCLLRSPDMPKSKSKTFGKKSEAIAWGKRKIAEWELNGFPVADDETANVPLRIVIQKYIDDPYVTMCRSKEYSLLLVSDCDLGQVKIHELNENHIVQFCKERIGTGISPATVNCDVSNLKSVLSVAKPLYQYNIDDSSVRKAMPTLKALKLIAKSNRRNRRVVGDELDRIFEGLKEREGKRGAIIPYIDLLEFSLLSCMRIGEVCSILWSDLDVKQKAVMVRDRKDPRKKIGNHMIVPLIGGAFEIVMRQPRTEKRIFPYVSSSVSKGYRDVRNKLGIVDLRYHDMRREGASRLFEKGYHVDEVAQVTGHRDLNTLWQIYTELYPKRLVDKWEKEKEAQDKTEN